MTAPCRPRYLRRAPYRRTLARHRPGEAGAPARNRHDAPRPPVNKWLVTLSVTFGTLMGTIDASIVNVALPHIRGSVGATLEEITWITTGFVVANVIVMPLTGFLSRMFGQKRVYLTSLVVFLLGSVLCGTAHTLTTLAIFRVLQGLGAGALQPTEQAILRRTFPPARAGHGHGRVRHGGRAGPGDRANAGRLHRRPLQLGVDLLHQPAGRRPGLADGLDLRPRGRGNPARQPRPGRARKEERRLDRHRHDGRRAGPDPVRARRGHARRLVRVAHHLRLPGRRHHRARRVRHSRVHRRRARGRSATVQGQDLHVRHAHRRRAVRHSHGQPLSPARLHAGDARLLGHRHRAWHCFRARASCSWSTPSWASSTTRCRCACSWATAWSACPWARSPWPPSPCKPAWRKSSWPRWSKASASRASSFRWPPRLCPTFPSPAWPTRPGSIRSFASSAAPSAWPSSPPCSRATEPSRAPASACTSPRFAPRSLARLAQITAGLARTRARSRFGARLAPCKALHGLVFGQGMTLAFERTFYLAGIVFLTVLPLLVFPQARTQAHRSHPSGVAHGSQDSPDLKPEIAPSRAQAKQEAVPHPGRGGARVRRYHRHLPAADRESGKHRRRPGRGRCGAHRRARERPDRQAPGRGQPAREEGRRAHPDRRRGLRRAREAGRGRAATPPAPRPPPPTRRCRWSKPVPRAACKARAPASRARRWAWPTPRRNWRPSRAALERAKAEARKGELDLQRTKQLVAGNALPRERLDNAQVAYDASQAALAQAQAQVAAATEMRRLASTRVDEARGRLDQSTPIAAQIAVGHGQRRSGPRPHQGRRGDAGAGPLAARATPRSWPARMAWSPGSRCSPAR